MPSVFTIQGPDLGRSRKRRCKRVRNGRNGCTIEICYVGKDKSPTGWKFSKGSTSCPKRRR